MRNRSDDYGDEDTGRYQKTSDFSTTSISSDGRFLGVKLSHDMASKLNTVKGALTDWVRRKAEKLSDVPARKFAKDVLGATEHEANHFAGHATNVVGYGVIFGDQLLNIGGNLYDSTRSLDELRRAVRPLSNAGAKNVSPLSGNNEVVANARTKIKDVFWRRMGETAVGALAVAPAFYTKINEQSGVNRERRKKIEFEEAKEKGDAAVNAWLEKEMGLKAATLEAEINTKSLEAVLNMQREKYLAEYKAFEAAESARVKASLENTLQIDPQRYRSQIKRLKQYGIDTRACETSYYNPHPDIPKAIAEIRQDIAHEMPELVENELKRQFVKRNGAFDEEWLEFQTNGRDKNGREQRKPTHEERLEQFFTKTEKSDHEEHDEEGHGHRRGDSRQGSELATGAAGLGAGIASEILAEKLIGKTREKYSKPIALDRILHLRRVIEEAKDHTLEQVPGMGDGAGEMSYTRYVHEIFQQHQHDCKRRSIGKAFSEHFESAGWDDNAIQQLPDTELSTYEYAVKTIAKRIKDKHLDAIALIDLVGDKDNKIVRNDGHSFGPRGAGNDETKIRAKIDSIINEKKALFQADAKQTDAQINDKLGDFIFGIEDMKAVLESKTIAPDERAFMFTLFTDVLGTDEHMLRKMGVSKARNLELRQENKEEFSGLLDGVVSELAKMLESDPESLAKILNLTEKQKQLILSFPEQLQAGKHVIDVTENADDTKALETIAANAVMALGKKEVGTDANGKPESFWQRLVTATRELKEAKQTPQEKPAKDAAPMEAEGEEKPASRIHERGFAKDFEKKDRSHRHRVEKGADSPDSFMGNNL